jgi:hypothetical protein
MWAVAQTAFEPLARAEVSTEQEQWRIRELGDFQCGLSAKPMRSGNTART